MRWVEVMEAVIAELKADVGMAGVAVLMHGEFSGLQVPSLAWLVYGDRREENTNPIRVQFDIYARGLDQTLTIESAVRRLHGDTPRTIQGVRMWATLDDARGDAAPDPGVTHRSLDFIFEPAREAA